MATLEKLLENNRKWSASLGDEAPDFLKKLSEEQRPEYLWIGCSDSRVGPDKLVGLPPGSIFVHRNVGNVFASNDLNCLAVLQYAVEILRVPTIIVSGHYDDHNIRHLRPSCSHCGKGFVTWRIDKGNTTIWGFHMVSPNMLGNAARFSSSNLRFTNIVQK